MCGSSVAARKTRCSTAEWWPPTTLARVPDQPPSRGLRLGLRLLLTIPTALSGTRHLLTEDTVISHDRSIGRRRPNHRPPPPPPPPPPPLLVVVIVIIVIIIIIIAPPGFRRTVHRCCFRASPTSTAPAAQWRNCRPCSQTQFLHLQRRLCSCNPAQSAALHTRALAG
jgi:hypothetical protein